MVTRRKIMTSRSKQYGVPGDTFEAFDCQFILTDVRDEALGVVATEFFHEEGCDSKEEFIAIWNSIHPRVGYSDSQRVYLHEFHRVIV